MTSPNATQRVAARLAHTFATRCCEASADPTRSRAPTLHLSHTKADISSRFGRKLVRPLIPARTGAGGPLSFSLTAVRPNPPLRAVYRYTLLPRMSEFPFIESCTIMQFRAIVLTLIH